MSDILMQQMQRKEHEKIVDDFLAIYPQYSDDFELIDNPLTSKEQGDLEDELIVLMHHRFLAGFDSKFIDYNKIDNNEYFVLFLLFRKYDNISEYDRDDEEQFFDQEEETVLNKNSEYTGELDY